MKLAIDLQSCQTDSRDRGIGRYSFSLASHLVKQSGTDEAVVLLDAVDPRRLRDVRQRLRHGHVDAPTATFGYPAVTHFTDLHVSLVEAAGLLKSRLVKALNPDVLLVTSFFEVGSAFCTEYDWHRLAGIPKAVVAYDLIPILFPERYLPEGHFISHWYREKLESFRQFDLYLAISEATRSDLVERLGIEEHKIHVVGAGLDWHLIHPDQRSTDQQEAALKALGITKPYVLMVGNADWRKNSIGALQAFASLPHKLRSQHQLVFTRVGDDVHQALSGSLSHVASQVVLTGNVDEATLSLLYKRCAVFFFPSLYEGFGLPVLEAMALGAPVLSSCLGALPEVVHDPAMLFDPRDAEASVAILRRALEDMSFRSALQEGANEHAHSFTWERCAEAAREALRGLGSTVRGKAPEAWRPSVVELGKMAEALNTLEGSGVPTVEAERALRSSLQCLASGHRRRILVDITEVVRLDARSGIQRVVRNYCTGLIRLAQDEPDRMEVVPICWTESGLRYAWEYVKDRLGAPVDGEDAEVEVAPNDLVLMLDSSWWSPERFDVFHAQVRSAGGEIVWMVYDLVPILTPEYCDPVMPPVFKAWVEHVAATTDGCICISEATRSSLNQYLDSTLPNNSHPWSRVVHLGADLESGQAQAPTDEIVALVRRLQGIPYFIAVGTIEPRKDYRTILDAFAQLWRDNCDVALVIVGKQGWNVDALANDLRRHPENARRLFWMEGLSDGDVHHLLVNSTALIQASIAEGYGLPVAEAGRLGIPLVLSDIPVFHEIAGGEATYFSVGDSPGLASILKGSTGPVPLRRPEHVELMTWSESSRRLCDILLPP